MPENLQENRQARIESDLASFADPGGIKVSGAGRRFHAEWRMRGEPREATFTASAERGITVHIDGMKQPYTTFLADTRMADLKQVAQMIEQTGRQEIFVPTKARRTDTDATGSEPAIDLLTKFLEGSEANATQVIMVTGGAGAGKTHVLRKLVLQQAKRYLHGHTEKLLLYVNAQGRALARLNEALATELQDLKVNLTYHSVATLARVGLLVPVIDGFDELLGVSGYDDAFNSLATFLKQLEGEGQLIASARSVYYEEEFLSRADGPSATGGRAGWSHVPIEIIDWEEEDQNHFLDGLAERESLSEEERTTLRARIKDVFSGNEDLSKKPLFFARTVDLLCKDSEFSSGADLLGTLTERFLEREQQEKLLDRQHNPLLSKTHIKQLMEELAEEMWNQETRELDPGSVREVAEYILVDREIPEPTQEIVIERMPTLAFFAPSEKHAGILFEHEVFFFHFLARVIVNRYIQGADLRIILSRSALPEFVAERVAFELGVMGGLSSLDEMQEIFDQLSKAGKTEWRRTTQVRENAGLIVLALLRKFANDNHPNEILGRTISTVTFPGGDLRDITLRNCALTNVSVLRTNLGGTKFFDCNARNLLLMEPRVKAGSTRLELNGLRVPEQVIGLQLLSDEGHETTYVPEKIKRVLRQCGAPVAATDPDDVRNVSDELMNLLDRLMRVYKRANPVSDGDQNLQNLFKDPQWSKLRELLIEHGIVKRVLRSASGSRKEFLRRQFPPSEVMSGSNRTNIVAPQIARFWDSLEAETL